VESAVTGPAGGWPDELDETILDRLRDLHERLDPPPADLTERVLFAVALADLDGADLDIEVARLREDELVGSGARATERTRTISFEAASLSIMVTVVEEPDGRVRVDGWLAPPAPHRVELRMEPAARRTALVAQADEAGRFVLAAVPRGLAQLVVHVTAADGATTVVTPSLVL
jgi:hypothetical protein